MFRTRVWALGLALSLAGAAPSQAAMPLERAAAPTGLALQVQYDDETDQYVVGGRTYCWYDDGWNGPGWYVCGYDDSDGYGWGGGPGWRGFVRHRHARAVQRRWQERDDERVSNPYPFRNGQTDSGQVPKGGGQPRQGYVDPGRGHGGDPGRGGGNAHPGGGARQDSGGGARGGGGGGGGEPRNPREAF